ncbi:TetR/AcrR family transcriptional regulator [Streptomyces sp. A5-4]|uniref:TetR/AcrR family transcriptional regulator n=1 Tax=Streptomyces sp. A5-4 TaxID=3384771 RepID=UPI003DAA4AA5
MVDAPARHHGRGGGSGDIRRSLELLWGTGERPSRGPKPGLTLDRIVATAIGIADAEGLDAVSMRRLSTDLGTGTMSLCRYVPSKVELLDLMLDRVRGETLDAAGPHEGADWQGAVEGMARGDLDLFRRHPWLLKVNQARTVLGPSAVRGLEAAVGALKGMGLTDPELIAVIITIQSYVTGTARTEIQTAEAVRETGLSHEAFWEGQQPYLERAMLSGDFPRMAALSEDTFATGFDHLAFGLRRLIDGFETLVRQRAEENAGENAGKHPEG